MRTGLLIALALLALLLPPSASADEIAIIGDTLFVSYDDQTPAFAVLQLNSNGNNELAGNKGNDELSGGSGDDVLTDGEPTDTGGSGGDDSFFGGPDDDYLNGGRVRHNADSGSGGDVMDGGPGSDVVDYSQRIAPLSITEGSGTTNDGQLGEGDDVSNVETILAGSAGDVVLGDAGDDTIHGGAGPDTLGG